MAAEDLAAIPMVGNVLRALEFVLVDKADDASRRRAAEDLKKSLGDPRAPRFLVFPEGQTNNGSRLIGFKDGAFRLGHGVQPVAVTYEPRGDYDPTNVDDMVWHRAGQESEIDNFKGSFLGRFPLVSADFWTGDHLSERSRSVNAFSGTSARGTLTLK